MNRAFDQLHHQRVKAAGVFEPLDVCDVRMIQRPEDVGFALEPGEPFGIVRESRGQN